MYQSDSFYISNQSYYNHFSIIVTSAFKILADSTYHHYCDEEEKAMHSANTIAFIRCTHGQGKIQIENDEITIRENECVFIRFQEIKEYKSTSNIWGYRWTNFQAKYYTNEFELNKIYKIPFTENEDFAFNKLLSNGQNYINANYINALFQNYFYSVMLESKIEKTDSELSTNTKLIDEMCSYIQQKLYCKITINEISDFFKISPRRLHQIFTSQLNISPKKYILKKKMEEGYKLLVQTSSPINKIADMLCFSSAYHFTNEFKKTFGQSPSEVRKMEQFN